MALGALPKAAMPAGNDKTPAPMMDLTRLKISSGIVAVPSLRLVLPVVSDPPPDSCITVENADDLQMRDALVTLLLPVDTHRCVPVLVGTKILLFFIIFVVVGSS